MRLTGSGAARTRPQVDSAVHGELVDPRELGGTEVEVRHGRDVVLQLADAGGADECGGDAGVAKDPGDGQLGEGLTAFGGEIVERPDVGQVCLLYTSRCV